MKFNIITHITTSCNYNCSYCDVIKNKKQMSSKNIEDILEFIKNNKYYIKRFKFFGGEPLLAWDNVKYIIDNSLKYIWNNYEIVTNTSLLNDEIGEYFEKYFKIIFFSIDTENKFDYNKIEKFIKKYNLEEKVYFNLVISPNKEKESLGQFYKLYNIWFRWYNLLPVYFTKPWTKIQLYKLADFLKYIIDLSLKDNTLRMYWFMKDETSSSKLAYNSLFIDIDTKVYFSDLVSTYSWSEFKDKLFIWNLSNLSLSDLESENIESKVKILNDMEQSLSNLSLWQNQLHKIMDYFSKYLIKNNGKQRKPII